MTFDYTKLALTASKLIAQFGSAVTLRQKTDGTYDVTQAKVVGGAQTDSAVNAAFFDFPPNLSMYRGQAVRSEDARVLMEAIAGVVPQQGDILINSLGIQYTVLDVNPEQPGALALVYELHVRR